MLRQKSKDWNADRDGPRNLQVHTLGRVTTGCMPFQAFEVAMNQKFTVQHLPIEAFLMVVPTPHDSEWSCLYGHFHAVLKRTFCLCLGNVSTRQEPTGAPCLTQTVATSSRN